MAEKETSKPQHPKALDISGPYNLQEIILVKQENKEKMLLGFFCPWKRGRRSLDQIEKADREVKNESCMVCSFCLKAG